MGFMASGITDNSIIYLGSLQWRHNGRDSVSNLQLTIVYSIVYSDVDQRKHQSFALLAFVRGIHRGPVNSPHKWPVTRKMFPFDDVIMNILFRLTWKNKQKQNKSKLHIASRLLRESASQTASRAKSAPIASSCSILLTSQELVLLN